MNGVLLRKKGPPVFLYQTPLVARRPVAFSIVPTDQEPGTGDRRCVVSLRLILTFFAGVIWVKTQHFSQLREELLHQKKRNQKKRSYKGTKGYLSRTS